jgi:hypothetical protein
MTYFEIYNESNSTDCPGYLSVTALELCSGNGVWSPEDNQSDLETPVDPLVRSLVYIY